MSDLTAGYRPSRIFQSTGLMLAAFTFTSISFGPGVGIESFRNFITPSGGILTPSIGAASPAATRERSRSRSSLKLPLLQHSQQRYLNTDNGASGSFNHALIFSLNSVSPSDPQNVRWFVEQLSSRHRQFDNNLWKGLQIPKLSKEIQAGVVWYVRCAHTCR